MKTCRKCDVAKPLDAFYKHPLAPDGLQYACKDCQKAAAKTPKGYAATKRYRQNNPDRVATYNRNWLEGNREIKSGHNQKRRAMIDDSALPSDYMKRLFDFYECCGKCGTTEQLSLDHVIPLSLGGTHTWDNFQVLCRSCNSSKGNRSSADYRLWLYEGI